MQFTGRQIIVDFAAFTLVGIAIHTYVLMDYGQPLYIALTDSIITQLVFAVAATVLYITLSYYHPTRENLFYIRIWAILLAVGNTIAIEQLNEMFFSDNIMYMILLKHSIPLRFIFQALLLALVTLVLWFTRHTSEQRSLEEHKRQNEKLARDAELYNLRQQLQPHFLFNSLNSISSLAGSKPEQARRMVQQLSEFLRHTLRKDEQQLITLKEELHQLDLYLEIEKVRFGNRLRSRIELVAGCEEKLLPVLVLQPLVENAIKFGLYDTLGEVEIVIEAGCSDGQLQICISNPFDAVSHRASVGTGFGLESIRRRLYLLYANNDLVRTEINQTIFTVRVNIPQP